MRILYSHRVQSRDGMSVHIEALVAAFRAAGHEVCVVGPPMYAAAAFGGETEWVGRLRARLPRFAAELAELAYNIPAYWRLWRTAHRFRPEMIYERYNLFFVAGVLLARQWRLPYIVEANSPLADERARYGGLSLAWLARGLERVCWRTADRLVAVTSVLADRLAEQGAPRARIEIVPNGIDPSAYRDLPARPVDPDPLVLGFVGFVRDWHGLEALLDQMAADTNPATARITLVVIGDGPARAGLEAQAARLGLGDRVRFMGLAERAAIPLLIAGFDIALQPRVTAYASPLKVFEYMAVGRAIVAPDLPNIREVLDDGTTALLFDPARPEALWASVRRLAADAPLRARLGTAARAAVTERGFTWGANAARAVTWAEAIRLERASRVTNGR